MSPEQQFSEDQEKKIKEMLEKEINIFYNNLKQRAIVITGIERGLNQKIDNIEATQKIIIENQGGIKSLVGMTYDSTIRNREIIIQNGENIDHRLDVLIHRFDVLEKKIDDLKIKSDI